MSISVQHVMYFRFVDYVMFHVALSVVRVSVCWVKAAEPIEMQTRVGLRNRVDLARELAIYRLSKFSPKSDDPVEYIHRVKLRHRVYGHDTIAILWV